MNTRIRMLLGLLMLVALTGAALAPVAAATPAQTVPIPWTREQVQFQPGTASETISMALVAGQPRGFTLRIAVGQTLYITFTGDASAGVLGPGDVQLADMAPGPGPRAVGIPRTGSYTVVLAGQGNVSLSVYIPPAGAGGALPVPFPARPERVYFAGGETSYTASVTLTPPATYGYVLGISAGQTLYVTTAGAVTVYLTDVARNLVAGTPVAAGQWHFAIPRTGDYVLILSGRGPVTATMHIPPRVPTPVPAQQRVLFGRGNTSAAFSTYLRAGTPRAYVLGAAAGQTLYVSTFGKASVLVLDPAGRVLGSSMTPYGAWCTHLPAAGDYSVILTGSGPVSVTFYIPPR